MKWLVVEIDFINVAAIYSSGLSRALKLWRITVMKTTAFELFVGRSHRVSDGKTIIETQKQNVEWFFVRAVLCPRCVTKVILDNEPKTDMANPLMQ